jgi:hypothetical protein
MVRTRVMRTRPKFDAWSDTVTVTYNDTEFNASDIGELFILAGEQVGVGAAVTAQCHGCGSFG